MKARRLVGREGELAVLEQALAEGGPLLTFVHGPPGIGKSALLRSFLDQVRERNIDALQLNCRDFEPTERGFLDALSQAFGRPLAEAREAAAALERSGTVSVLAIDTYELFRLSDTWLREVLVPKLGEGIRVVIASREPPISSWFDARGAPESFRSILLGPLDEDQALEALRAAGVSENEARSVNRIARGHPLALQVAAVAVAEQPRSPVEERAIPRVVEELIRLYVDHLEPQTRRVLDAAAIVRRVTGDLLTRMLPDISVQEAMDRLSSLPFVEDAADGLRIHEAVQSAVAARVRSRDPEAHREYRAAAWRYLRRQLDEAPPTELRRYTADVLYLLENAALREVFFPTTAHLYSVEQARSDDGAAIAAIVGRHHPEKAAELLLLWWEQCPSSYRVVRDRAGTLVGLTVIIEADAVPYGLVRADPVLADWREDLRRRPLPGRQRALFQRTELSRDRGEQPSPVQAATWLDLKRVYMQMRPHLGRLYSLMADPAPYREALTTLGFWFSPVPVNLGREYFWGSLDFGPDSVDGWLTRLAAAEIGVHEEGLLDVANHELVLDDGRVPLSPLEFGVLKNLLDRKGKAVSRATLIEQVWGHSYLGGSNVVDVVVRSLRKKLGQQASLVETVRGAGYRFRAARQTVQTK